MIFMSQSGLSDPSREHEWDAWYIEHLRIMATVPGVASTQRFKTTSPGHSPSLAMYSMASAEVFRDPYYLSVRGMGEWLPLIQKHFYRRNLFDGLDIAPDVGKESVLLVTDRSQPGPMQFNIGLTWLKAVGIDMSTPYRGIAVVKDAAAAALPANCGFAVYRPVTLRNLAH